MAQCFACKKAITAASVKDNDGNVYHAGCFVCGWCSTPLLIDAYYSIDGKNVCQACRNKERCFSCGHMITESKYVAVDSHVWHPDCFVCDTCYIELPAKFFFEDNKLWCADCVKERGSENPENQCAKCHKVVRSCIKALGKKWHEECFTCTRCNKPFPDDEFVKVNDMPYCDPCAALGSDVLRTVPAALKGIHGAPAGRGGGGAAGGAGATRAPAALPTGAGAGGAGGRGGAAAAGGAGATRAPAAVPAAATVPAPAAAAAAARPPPIPPRDDDDDDATAPHGLGTSGSKYDNTRPGKLGPVTSEKRGTRDYKTKPVLMVGGDSEHLNELDNYEFSSSRR